jgi:hypothetical protein
MEDKQDKSFSLLSEKARNIVGQIPHTLTIYGIFVIIAIILVIVGISLFIPYKHVVSGVVFITERHVVLDDSALVDVELKLPKEYSFNSSTGKIVLIGPFKEYNGKLVEYSPFRNSNGSNTAIIKLSMHDLYDIQQTEVDFRLTISESTVFNRFWESLTIPQP